MLFYAVAVCGIGVLYGLDTVVAQAHGAGDPAAARRALVNGLWLGALVTPFAMGGMLACLPLLRAFGTNPRVYDQLVPFVTALAWSIPPFFVYSAFRRYLQGVHVVKPLTFAVVSANIVNLVANWILIYGHWGAPALGIAGSAWSTCLARLYMAGVLVATAIAQGAFHDVRWQPDQVAIRRLFSLGWPAAAQIGLEAAVFAIVSALAAQLDEASLAAHGVALNVISVTYMVPLGIASAAAVRVGHAVGRKDRRGAASAGWTALALSALFMLGAGLVIVTVPAFIIRLFSADPAVVRVGTSLLVIAAAFELGDGSQVVATGALRGLGDTRTPMLVNLAFYWGVGLPVAYVFCFRLGWGAPGLWLGLCAALLLIGATLIGVWKHRLARTMV
jgi:multidrug resistance protein, MATE family